VTLHRIDPRPHRAIAFTPLEQRRHVLVDAAVLADRLGYHTVLIPEGWGFDAGVVLAEIATRTTDIRIATGIASIWGRSPATLAMMAATLDDLSGGRFTLGLGASTAVLAERFHDRTFHRPAARLDHTIAQVRSLLGGGRTAPAGGGHGLRLGVPARPDLPIWAAALGPRATSVAVSTADGWLLAMVPLDGIDTVRKVAGSDGDGDGVGDPTLIAGPMIAAGPGARQTAEQLVGWYLTGMGPLYGDFVASVGFEEQVAALRATNPRPAPGAIDWPFAADPLLAQLATVGDPPAIASQLAAWDEQVDIVAVCVGPGPAEAVLAAVAAGAPPVRHTAAS
jgi:alkanesulfonate monooxygenase SsuD/methylene tetrahydromethanopterin reductase-like flavin-dependent oxidoreductase (luciferase family)